MEFPFRKNFASPQEHLLALKRWESNVDRLDRYLRDQVAAVDLPKTKPDWIVHLDDKSGYMIRHVAIHRDLYPDEINAALNNLASNAAISDCDIGRVWHGVVDEHGEKWWICYAELKPSQIEKAA
jgi:hypothetical protein